MRNFKKYFIVPATPEELYLALTTEVTIRLWTGDVVEIDPREGGEFSLWDGSITGHFIELTPSSKIIQEWDFGNQEEPSIVTLKLHENKKGTSLEVNHINIPDEAYDEIVAGWEEEYIASLVDFYEDEE